AGPYRHTKFISVWYDTRYRAVRTITRQRLVPPLEDDATPSSPAGRRGVATFSRWKTRRRLVLRLEDETTPRCLVPARGDARYRPV
ncbi:hypothetical protein BHE74_00024390, partial [Ensete ventricosum]